MKKRVVILLLAIAVTVGMIPSSAVFVYSESDDQTAAGTVAKIGSKEYSSFTDAVAEAADGQTIKVMKNIKGCFEINNKSITIDLNSNVVSAGRDDEINLYSPSTAVRMKRAFIVNGGEVEIKNGSIMESDASGNTWINKVYKYFGGAVSAYNAKVHLTNVNITGNKGVALLAAGSSAVLNISGCSVKDNSMDSDLLPSSDPRGIIHTRDGAILNIEGTGITGNKGSSGLAPLFLSLAGNTVIKDSDIQENEGSSCGGIYFDGTSTNTSLKLINTTVKDNKGVSRNNSTGGLWLYQGKLELERSAIYENKVKHMTASSVNNSCTGHDLWVYKLGGKIQSADKMSDHGSDMSDYVYQNGNTGAYYIDGIPGGSYKEAQMQLNVVKKEKGAWKYEDISYETLSEAVGAYKADSGEKGIITLTEDIKETSHFSNVAEKDDPLVIDLNGHTMTPASKNGFAIVTNTSETKTEEASHIVVKNGTISGGGGGIRVNESGTSVMVQDLTIKDMRSAAITTRTTKNVSDSNKSVKIKNCYIENCGHKNYDYSVYALADLVIEDSHIDGNYGGVYTQAAKEIGFKNTTFNKNTSTAIYFQNVIVSEIDIENCQFNENDLTESESTDPQLIVFPSTARKTFNIKNCSVSKNEGTKNTIYCSGSKSVYNFKNCRIEDNRAFARDNGYATNGTSGGIRIRGSDTTCNIIDTVVKGNTATGQQDSNSNSVKSFGYVLAGGINSMGILNVTGKSAVYENRVYVINSEKETKANDIFDRLNKAKVIPAKEMSDGEKDFTDYVWREAKTVGDIEGSIPAPGSGQRFYTAQVKSGSENIAAIGDKEYATLKEAVADSKDGDVITIIVNKYNPNIKSVTEDNIDVDKKITIDLMGVGLESDEDSCFDIKEGGSLTIKDSVSDEYYTADEKGQIPKISTETYRHAGYVGNTIKVEKGGSLNVVSTLGRISVDHDGEMVKFQKPLLRLYATLGEGKYLTFGEGWRSEATNIATRCQIEFNLKEDVISELNSDNECDDVVLAKGGSEGIKKISKVNGLTNNEVRKLYEDDLFLLRKGINGIYVDGVAGRDDGEGTEEDPLHSFEQAKSKLSEQHIESRNNSMHPAEDAGKYECIIVKNTLTVKDDTLWNLKIDGKVYSLMRWEEFDGNLVKVAKDGKLKLEDIKIDGLGAEWIRAGKNDTEGSGSLIRVEPEGELHIADGAALQNNHLQTVSGWTSCGGAVYSAGFTKMTGGKISYNGAVQGGGIYQVGKEQYKETDYTGKLIVSGGSIENNTAVYCDKARNGAIREDSLLTAGAGIMAGYGAQVCFSGGTIKNNRSMNIGGGISIGNTRDSEATIYTPSGETVLSMHGGVIDSNYAASEGGGIYVQMSSTAFVREGDIINNKAQGFFQGTGGQGVIIGGDVSHCGGGIYVNGAAKSYYNQVNAVSSNYDAHTGTLHIRNAELAYNKAGDIHGGSAYAFCASGDAKIFQIDGSLIHDNEQREGIDVIMTTVDHFSGQRLKRQVDGLNYFVSEYTLNGEAYNWKKVDIDNGFGIDEENISSAQLHWNNLRLGLHTDLSEKTTDLTEAISKTKVHILNNEAAYYGGGIGSNGQVFDGFKVPLVDVNVEKEWNDDNNEDGLRPDMIKVKLQRKAEDEEEWQDIKTEYVKNEDGKWKTEFSELPKYKKFKSHDFDCPTICENCAEGGGEEDIEYEYRVVEDGSYRPVKEGSEIWTGKEDGKSIEDMYETSVQRLADSKREADPNYSFDRKITVVNYKLTNEIKPEEPPEEPPKSEEPPKTQEPIKAEEPPVEKEDVKEEKPLRPKENISTDEKKKPENAPVKITKKVSKKLSGAKTGDGWSAALPACVAAVALIVLIALIRRRKTE